MDFQFAPLAGGLITGGTSQGAGKINRILARAKILCPLMWKSKKCTNSFFVTPHDYFHINILYFNGLTFYHEKNFLLDSRITGLDRKNIRLLSLLLYLLARYYIWLTLLLNPSLYDLWTTFLLFPKSTEKPNLCHWYAFFMVLMGFFFVSWPSEDD